uniref:hypothetical protein n=1 Tax=Asaia prunellae TaxID=610245 RepID=UPI0005544860
MAGSVGYLPTTLTNVYIYTLNADGTVAAQNGNAAIGPLTASYDGKTWTYKDASGKVILSGQNTTTGSYQTENGFISYNPSTGYTLVSNDKITDPSSVKWSNQSGAVPGSTAYPSFAGASTSVKIIDSSGTSSVSYDRVSGGVTAQGSYDA